MLDPPALEVELLVALGHLGLCLVFYLDRS